MLEGDVQGSLDADRLAHFHVPVTQAMVCSVTEGEDKPLKYPLMFRTCDLVVVNKVDLLPHLEYDLDRLLANVEAVHPGVETMTVSARTGEGVDGFRDWLAGVATREAAPA